MGAVLSEATDIERIALAEIRQLREAQRGNPQAVTSLLRPYLPGLWSVCRGQLGSDAAAQETLLDFRAHLPVALQDFATDRAFGLQLYRHLWDHLVAHHGIVEPGRPDGIEAADPKPRAVGPRAGSDRAVALDTLARVDPFSRLVWLFWSVTGLSASRLAELVQVPEERIREARSRVSWRLHEALTR